LIRAHKKSNLSAVLCLTLCLLPGAVAAHALGTNLVQMDITQESALRYTVTWKSSSRGLKVVFPSDCVDQGESSGANASDDRSVECAEPLDGKKVFIDGLTGGSLDLMVRVVSANADAAEGVEVFILNGDNNSITISEVPTAIKVAKAYFLLGVDHIFGGIDHLMFVLGLLLILAGWRQLAFTITAFTVAHSITLALATVGVISVPQAPVEAVIALSILFLATEYAHKINGIEGWTTRRPWLVSFSVGLLHGLGFANALTEMGLPQTQIPMALLTFNLGVEAGQLTFVATVLLFMGLVVKLFKEPPAWTRTAAAYAIGTVAAFWFLQRTLAIFS